MIEICKEKQIKNT